VCNGRRRILRPQRWRFHRRSQPARLETICLPASVSTRGTVRLDTEAGDSVTGWIGHIKRGDHAAAQLLWERYFERLVRLARGKLAGARGLVADEEDVALSAFDSFCRAATAGRFPKLDDRDDLWRLLVALTARKAISLRKHSSREKRGGGRVLDEAAFVGASQRDEPDGLETVLGDEPTPEVAAAVAEQCRMLLDVLDREDPNFHLRRLALLKLEGFSNREIADRLGCSLRTVANRLKLIRSLWE
jgi:DNA-directed RNA polymerase specialized sigma24 family protein